METSLSMDKRFSALNFIDAVVLVADSNGQIVFFNNAVTRVFGYSENEILGDGWWKIVAPDASERAERKAFVAGMASGTIDINSRRLYETPIKTKAGKVIWLQWTNSRTEDNFVVGAGQVITEKKEIEEQLKVYSDQVELLHLIDKQILSMQPIEQKIRAVLIELEKNLSFVCRASVCVFNFEISTAVIYRRENINNSDSFSKFEFPISSIRSAKYLTPTEHFLVADLANEKELSATDKENLNDGIRSYLCVPLSFSNQLTGALFLCSDVINPFKPHDIELAYDVANSLSLALEQYKLEQSLIRKNAEKELLLKEIHHRVKNNLQVISSLLNLQSSSFSDPIALEAFQKSKDRIVAMSLIHTKLYESGNLSEIDFEEYLHQLVASIADSYGSHEIEWEANAEGIKLGIDVSINLGLIITELASNAFKHAFDKRTEGVVKVEVKSVENGKTLLTVSDNGKGLAENFDISKSSSLGLEIVQSLTEQLEGTLEYASENGTRFLIKF
jgi:PAS domain S-box-containing protein